VIASTAADVVAPTRKASADRLVRTAAASLRGRVILVDARGRLIADSTGSERLGDSYGGRPEIAAALAGRTTQEQRHSADLGGEILATAVPVTVGGRTAGAVRVTQSVAAVQRSVRRSFAGLGLVAGVVLLVGLAAGAVIAAALVRPLGRLEATARRIAHGDLESRAAVEGTAEQRSLAESFNEMAENLHAALERQRRFVADASHELRTPLTGLRLRMEEARAAVGPGQAADDLDAGLDEADRLAGIIDDLLDLSRAGRGASAEPFDVGAAVQDVADRWEGAAAERGVRILARPPAAPVRAQLAPAALARILDALVENAVVYSAHGGEVELTVETQPGTGGATIAVLDRGPGLRPGEEEEVFGRFHRGSASHRGVPGTGLGLAIARELARAQGGEVTIGNRSGGGARAVVVLEADR
jgi:signal transduction histidine kinase